MDALGRGRSLATMAPVWALAILGVVLVAVISGDRYLTWLPVVGAGCLLGAFGIQLAVGMRSGLVTRLAGSVGGAVIVLLIATVALLLADPDGIHLLN